MTDARPDKPYDFNLVAVRLAEAGMTLLAMHIAGVRPAGYRSFWPDVAGAESQARELAAPTARKISEMDEALGWIGLVPERELTLRKLVGARSLCRPDPRSGHPKPIFSWKTLGDRMGCSEVTAKTWWIAGVEMIVDRLNQPGLCQTARFRGGRQASETVLSQAGRRLRRTLREAETA